MSLGSPLWYLTRGAGVVSLLLLTTTVLMGIGTWTRWASARLPRRLGVGLHRNVSLLGVTFVAVHVVTAVTDGFVPLSLSSAVLPFTADYRPFWLGLGALAFDCLLALAVTSLLQKQLGWKRWRAVHWLAYACWPLAFVHGLGAGSDAGTEWFRLLAVACAAAVLGAGLARAALGRSSPDGQRPARSA
jgi:sulfoxide reductase heme-binding subunit YedZ